MSAALWVYLGGMFLVIAYSAYIDTDDPLVFLFVAVIWPIALALVIPVACGYAVRELVKGGGK